MTWQAAAAFLACARIGAVHSAVFAGFSAESLRDRVNDCESRVLITTDEGKRGGKTIATKASTYLSLLHDARYGLCEESKGIGAVVRYSGGRLAGRYDMSGPDECITQTDPSSLLQGAGLAIYGRWYKGADGQLSMPLSRTARLSNTSSSSNVPAARSTCSKDATSGGMKRRKLFLLSALVSL